MSRPPDSQLAKTAVNTIRFLAVDAVEKAKSGHPGLPMGAADFAFVLWSRYLRYDPTAPDWPDRDRFVLSAGHGSMLLYALLHLAGYDVPMSELQAFRQWESKTPGHPEFGHTPGVEATTGPLGQGIGNAIGMALAGKMAATRFNDAAFQPVAHRVFALCSDGDVMEGVSGEASSLAGHLGLGNLIVLYDDNGVSLDGKTSLSFSEDVPARYAAYGWHVQSIDGHDHDAIAKAIEAAIADRARPSFIACRTHIGYGAPKKQDTSEAHGAPLGPEETKGAKLALGWPLEPAFLVPDEVRDLFRARAAEGAALRTGWEQRFAQWAHDNPVKAGQWDAIWTHAVPDDLVTQLLAAAPATAAATREHGRAVMQKAAELVPGLVGGAADLASSTYTVVQGSPDVGPGAFDGRNIHFGVREHGMGAIVNGIAYHGAFRPYGSTFLVFSDYMRGSIRLSALSHLPVIFVFTHDSIFVGEDGPTHEPIEQTASLRLIPNLHVWRPADGVETALAWGMALERKDGPSALVLTRQKLPPIERPGRIGERELRRGGYFVAGDDAPDAVVAATGSELHLAVGARAALASRGVRLNIVSIPCVEIFDAQDEAYRASLFPEGVPVATIEAGRTTPWRALAGRGGLTIGIDHFGASAPGPVNGDKFGFTVDAVTARLATWLGRG
ncbi:MAG TPA: transketolase [Candidatus Polarisedimenticolaceae bacterium]|nr:transketolase [Candidatus Polarisedimenticolaceae bacterium]